MPRMIDSIRNSALPSNMMQFAAKGALLVAPQEMIEILVYLATHNKVFSQQAKLTLAGWDEASSLKAAADPSTPKEVLDYFTDPENLRPALLPALLENPSINESFLIRLAASAHRDQVEVLLNSLRVSRSQAVLEMLANSSNLTSAAAASVQEKLSALGISAEGAPAEPKALSEPVAETDAAIPLEASAPGEPAREDGSAELPEETITAFMTQHAAEIAAEAEKPFEPLGALHEAVPSEATEVPAEAKTAAAATSARTSEGAGIPRCANRMTPSGPIR